MANFLFDKAREKFLNGDLSWRDDDFKVCLLDISLNSTSLNQQTLGEIVTSNRIAISSTELSNKTSVNGVAKANGIQISGISTTKSIKSLVIFKVAPTLNDSPLIAHIDTADGIGFTPNSGNVIIQWNSSGIFKL